MAPTNTLTGTTGNDILNAPGSVDTLVQGLPGNDTITLIRSGDEADAGEGNDIIRQASNGTLANVINAGLGNDTIVFSGGAALFSGSISAASGSDLINFANGGPATLNGAFIGAGVGTDTVSLGAANLINTTVQGGHNADQILASAVASVVASYIGGGKGADTINVGVGATTSTVAAGEGQDVISMASGMTYVAGGAGTDTLNLGTANGAVSFGTVVGGGLADTITFGNGGLLAGLIYGDGLGVEAAGTGTGGTADGADVIGTGGALGTGGGITVFGAGGNDTINFGAVSTAGAYLNGGNNADRIQLGASNGSTTIMGGNGADTITAAAFNSAVLIGAGAGQDSIVLTTLTGGGTVNAGAGLDTLVFTSANNAVINGGSEADLIGVVSAGGSKAFGGTVNGGDGSDTIRLAETTTAQILGGAGADSIVLGSGMLAATNFAGSTTVNGGAGADTITLTNITVGTGSTINSATFGGSAYNLNVAYESGDVVSLNYGSTSTANWISTVTGTVVVLTANSVSGFSSETGIGNVLVFADANQTVIYAVASNQTSYYAINIAGRDLVNTTALGTVTFNSTNFGFALSNSNGNGLNITLA